MDDWIENARMIEESARGLIPPGDLARVRACRFTETGFDRQAMQAMAGLGWLSIRVPEGKGGSGLGLRETCELLRLLGRGLVPEPLVSAMLAARLLEDRLPEAASSGDAILVTAWQDATNALGWHGNTAKVHVPGAAGADIFAVLSSEGVALVPRDAAGLRLDPVAMQDGCTYATLHLDRIDAEVHAVQAGDAALDEAILLQAAYLLGVAERALEMTVEYLGIRRQFDRPIGSFQALQHRATEMKIQLELCRAGLLATAGRLEGGPNAPTRAAAVSRVKARASDLAMHVARESVQMHGAMGFTDEADIGLYVRKAMTETGHFGSARLHRARYLEAREGLFA